MWRPVNTKPKTPLNRAVAGSSPVLDGSVGPRGFPGARRFCLPCARAPSSSMGNPRRWRAGGLGPVGAFAGGAANWSCSASSPPAPGSQREFSGGSATVLASSRLAAAPSHPPPARRTRASWSFAMAAGPSLSPAPLAPARAGPAWGRPLGPPRVHIGCGVAGGRGGRGAGSRADCSFRAEPEAKRWTQTAPRGPGSAADTGREAGSPRAAEAKRLAGGAEGGCTPRGLIS
ncbi:elongation of very long chain fatty acids protein 6 isoform X2 [Choloepus didactylus]|uniref:elongation of very long chain fatty acids protein 6 isoform X2 n=1 Tax=Choloepus didactylus TaxID=27675 RepID=UPI00189E98FF|nr:elongation of very long chain fatty acids protein 6 isoform X2 [Choloepus didactylus]